MEIHLALKIYREITLVDLQRRTEILHAHSSWSVIDGRATVADYLRLCEENKQEFFALTEHGSLGGCIEFYLEARKHEIHPIIGCELYVDGGELREKNYPGHITVLAKNEAGYRALIAANNLAHRQFYYRPRLSIQQIIEHGFAKDWVVLSGCMSSPIFDLPFTESVEMTKALATASGNFFMEFMWHGSQDEAFIEKQLKYLEHAAAIHKATGLPNVITNDCHFAEQKNETLHRQILNSARNDKHELEFDGTGFYFKTNDELQKIAEALGCNDAVHNSLEIAKMCNIEIPEADITNWYVPDITGGQPLATLESIAKTRLQELRERGYGQEYQDRYEYELSVLKTSPAILNSYLVTYDLVDWCRQRNIPAAARGSMAGSLVSYLLEITREDPIKYNLSFARAVNPARPTIPDFDLDVSSIHRPAILTYLKERYENNIPIASYTHYGPKGAFRKVLNYEGLHSPPEINELSKQLPDDWVEGDGDLYSARDHEYVGPKPWWDKVPEQYRQFVAIYKGLYNNLSAHPCGILVSGQERELEHEVPLQWIASSKQLVSAFDMYTLKKVGLFKLDVLGLRTLDQLDYMERISGATLPDDNYDDQDTLKAFNVLKTHNIDLLSEIFQMDGYACRNVVKSIGIERFEDIIAANTLARPGCAQFAPYYRSGYANLLAEYPQIREVLEPTNGLILYQEQVMEISRILADFDDAEQDDVKESIKYFRRENWHNTIEPLFRQRCLLKGIDATNILEAIANMASYTFNKSHAMTYSAIAYRMMWYKVHYPSIYYAAVFDGADDKQRLVLESHAFNVKWQLADINHSQAETIVNGDEILLGLNTIKGVGPAAYEAIAIARPYVSIEDLESRVERRKCNVRVIANLKAAFACTSIGVPGTYSAFEEAFGFSYNLLNNELSKQLIEWQSIHAISRVGGFIVDIRPTTIQKVGPNQGKEMARIEVVSLHGKQRCVAFPDVWKKLRGKVYKGAPIKLQGEFQLEGDFIVQEGEELKV